MLEDKNIGTEADGSKKTNSKKETIEIEKGVLEGILSTMKALEENVKTLTKDNEMLKSVADKGRMFKYEVDNSKGGQVIRSAKVGMWEGRPIISWKKVKDEVYFRDGRMIVDQKICIFVLDDDGKDTKPIEVDYQFWANNTTTETGELISTLNDSTGDYWVLQLKNGRKVTLDIRYINPF